MHPEHIITCSDGFWPQDIHIPNVIATILDGTLSLSIAADVTLLAPLSIIHISSEQPSPRLHLTLGKNASLHLIETTHHAVSSLLNTSLTMTLNEGASLHHTRIDTSPTPLTSHSYLAATLKKNATLRSIIASSTQLSRHHATISLDEEGSSVTFQGLSILPQHHSGLFSLHVDHAAPNTSSSHLFKGLVASDGIGSSESRVCIKKEARNSKSRQHSHFLTIGATAHTLNKPSFEISTDDVEATHGATTGAVDQETLFYLCSRGLSEQLARQHVVDGFCDEIVRQLPPEAAKEFSHQIFNTVRGAL